ncbi:hypothetical protein ACFQZC_28425 [Streptacidiphilus monticola]
MPRRWGGTEGGFAELLARAAELGEASASAAWCAMLWAAHGRFATRLPEQAQQELWAAGPDVRLSAALAPPRAGWSGGRTAGCWTGTGTASAAPCTPTGSCSPCPGRNRAAVRRWCWPFRPSG